MKHHPELSAPKDPETVLSRYMSLGKFLDLLSSKTLYLSKVSNLGDKFEGSLTVPEFNARRQEIEAIFSKGPGPIEESMQRFTRLLRENTFVNCWTIGDVESEAMWRLYCGGNEGLCVRTTFGRLSNALSDDRVYPTEIRYLDYNRERFPSENAILGPFACKRSAFEHEREFRLLISEVPADFFDSDELPDISDANPNSGIRVTIDVDTLVESVLISPFAMENYRQVVAEAGARYFRSLRMRPSSLSDQPLY